MSGKTGYPHADKRNWIFISCHKQQQQNKLKLDKEDLSNTTISKAQQQKQNRQVELHQTKKLLDSKLNKMKRQPTNWEKIFANHISDRALIYKALNSQKKKRRPPPKKTPQLKNRLRICIDIFS